MKKLYVQLIFLCLCSVIHAQNNDLIAVYNQVVNTLDRYEFTTETEHWNKYYNSRSLKITYDYPNLIVSFYLELEKGYVRKDSDDIFGAYKLICPLTTNIVVEEDKYGNGEYAHLYFRNPTGIEIVHNGKSKLIEKYYFLSTRLTVKKLCTELNALKEQILSTQYKGTLGINSSTSSTKTNSANSTTPIQQNTDNYHYYKNSGFAIKKSYALKENTMFIDAYRRNKPNGVELISAYTCFQNAETKDPDYINVINVNVYKIDTPAEQTIAAYKRNLITNRNPCSDKTWNGLHGVEYSFKQDMGDVMLPTKVFYGYKGNKFYLIQIGALVDTDKKYNALLNSIKIL